MFLLLLLCYPSVYISLLFCRFLCFCCCFSWASDYNIICWFAHKFSHFVIRAFAGWARSLRVRRRNRTWTVNTLMLESLSATWLRSYIYEKCMMISMGVLSQQFAKSLFCSFNNALQRIDGVRNGPLSLCLNRDGPAVHCTRMHAMPCISGTFSLYLRLHSMLLWYEPRITTKEPVSATTTTAAHGISVGAMRVRVCGPRNEKKKKYKIRGWWDEIWVKKKTGNVTDGCGHKITNHRLPQTSRNGASTIIIYWLALRGFDRPVPFFFRLRIFL